VTVRYMGKCDLCKQPINEDTDKPDEAWCYLAGWTKAHVACANRETAARMIQEEREASV